jgi:hypothetical protein
MENLGDVNLALIRLEDHGQRITLSNLAEQGVPANVLSRTIVIQFGSDDGVFEALDPSGFILSGEWTLLQNAPDSLK